MNSSQDDGPIQRVAVLGLGTMGTAMATRIAGAGLPVTAWNRSPERAEALRPVARVATEVTEAVSDADVVLTMLFDAAAVWEVMTTALPAMRSGAIWMQSSTVGPQACTGFAQQADEAGVQYVDAPMLGTKQPAQDGTLTALVAGDPVAIARLGPILGAVATRTLTAGPKPPAASALKLAVNAWIATITAGIGQSLTIAERLGVDPALVLEALDGTACDSPYAQQKGGEILRQAFDPQFAVPGLLKDIHLAREETPRIAHALLNALDELYYDTTLSKDPDHDGAREDIAAVWRAFQR